MNNILALLLQYRSSLKRAKKGDYIKEGHTRRVLGWQLEWQCHCHYCLLRLLMINLIQFVLYFDVPGVEIEAAHLANAAGKKLQPCCRFRQRRCPKNISSFTHIGNHSHLYNSYASKYDSQKLTCVYKKIMNAFTNKK